MIKLKFTIVVLGAARVGVIDHERWERTIRSHLARANLSSFIVMALTNL